MPLMTVMKRFLHVFNECEMKRFLHAFNDCEMPLMTVR